MHATTTYEGPEHAPTLINWRAIFGGGIIGIGLSTLLSTLWLALAFGSGSEVVRDNLEWFLGGTAILSLLVSGYLAGAISGSRGVGAGLVQALALWSLVLIVTLAVAVPSLLRVLNLDPSVAADAAGPAARPLWPTFWSMLVALGAALLGGLLGGATPRRAMVEVEAAPVIADTTRTTRVGSAPEPTETYDRERRVS